MRKAPIVTTRALSSIFLLLASIAIASQAFAISFSDLFGTHEKDKFDLIHVQDLSRLMNDKNAQPYIFDANPQDVRESMGIIPGAQLLSSSDGYDVAKTLPADKNARLVFYCHNVR